MVWRNFTHSDCVKLATYQYQNYSMFKLLTFVFKALHNPNHLWWWTVPQPNRTLRSSNLSLLSVLRPRLLHRGDRAFAVVGPKLWNNLLLFIRTAPSLPVFKSALAKACWTCFYCVCVCVVHVLCFLFSCTVHHFVSAHMLCEKWFINKVKKTK